MTSFSYNLVAFWAKPGASSDHCRSAPLPKGPLGIQTLKPGPTPRVERLCYEGRLEINSRSRWKNPELGRGLVRRLSASQPSKTNR